MAPGLIDSDTGLAYGESLQWQTAIGGAGLAVVASPSATFLEQWGPDGLALNFTDGYWFKETGFYGSASIVGGGSGDGYNSSPDSTAASLLTYTSPSPKMTTGPTGELRFGAHNIFLNSGAPADQSVTVVSGASYALTLTGSVQTTLSDAATGTVTAGTTTFTAGSATLTFGSTSGSGTVHLRRTPSDDTYMAAAGAARYALPYAWGAGGGMLGILVEDARTNVFLNSSVGATQSITVSATAYTLSFYGTGTITLSGVSTAGPLVGTGTSDRVTLTFTPTAGSLTLTVSGACTNVQLEAGSYATSYFPAYAASATRSADNISLATSVFPYSATASTIYVQVSSLRAAGNPVLLALSDGTSNERIQIYRNSGAAWFLVGDGGVTQVAVSTAVTLTTSGTYKIIGAATQNSFRAAADGTLSTADNAGTMPTVNRLYLSQVAGAGATSASYVMAIMYLPERSSDSKLQEVTTA